MTGNAEKSAIFRSTAQIVHFIIEFSDGLYEKDEKGRSSIEIIKNRGLHIAPCLEQISFFSPSYPLTLFTYHIAGMRRFRSFANSG